MLGPARSEEWLEHRILEDAAVEGVFEAMEHLLATCEFVEGRHPPIVRASRHASELAVRVRQRPEQRRTEFISLCEGEQGRYSYFASTTIPTTAKTVPAIR